MPASWAGHKPAGSSVEAWKYWLAILAFCVLQGHWDNHAVAVKECFAVSIIVFLLSVSISCQSPLFTLTSCIGPINSAQKFFSYLILVYSAHHPILHPSAVTVTFLLEPSVRGTESSSSEQNPIQIGFPSNFHKILRYSFDINRLQSCTFMLYPKKPQVLFQSTSS